MKTLKGLIGQLFGHGKTAPPPLTARTHPPTCPVCGGSGRARLNIVCLLLPTLPIWEYCRACGSAGVVPAVILARDPGDASELRRYVEAARHN